jgi:fatty acid kinase fatty acid binding subunit
MSVVIVTDTAASFTSDLAAQWGVRLVPLTVTVAGRSYPDGEFDLSTLPQARVTTAGPPPGAFLAALRDAPAGAVVVTVAGSLSSTNAAARVAASLSDVRVEVVDSTTAAGGQTLVVLAAADCAASGRDIREVADAARTAAADVRLVGCLENLNGLARSGRVPGIAALAARKAGLQFMFVLQKGSIRPIKPAASRAAAFDRMVEMCVSSRRPGLVADVVVLGSAPGLEERLEGAIGSSRLPIGRRFAGPFGSAVSLYTGPRTAGLAWRWRTPRVCS